MTVGSSRRPASIAGRSGDKPSRAEAQGLLARQLADAGREAELVALPPVSSLGWPWTPLAFAAASVVLAAMLAIRRRA